MSEQALSVFSLEGYLDWEESQPLRHELVGGRAYVMSGGTERHGIMQGVIYELIAPGARSRGCRPFGPDRKLVTPSGDAYYPDAMICCGPATDVLYETDACLVFEVLSASTRVIDKREKLRSYQDLASIEAYIVVEPDMRRIEVATWPGGELGWEVLGPGEIFRTSFGILDLDGIYDQLDATAST
ncbi:MAG: Uma2 family endonuclease [Acidimicrobiales bacterium]